MESVCFSLQAVVWLITTDQRSGTSACLHGLLHTSPPAPPPPLFLCTTPHIVCILLFKNHCNVTAYEYSAAMLSHYYSSLAVEAVTSGYSMCILSVLQPPPSKEKKSYSEVHHPVAGWLLSVEKPLLPRSESVLQLFLSPFPPRFLRRLCSVESSELTLCYLIKTEALFGVLCDSISVDNAALSLALHPTPVPSAFLWWMQMMTTGCCPKWPRWLSKDLPGISRES